MMEAALLKTQIGYIPATIQDAANMEALNAGDMINIKFTRARNALFHRKFFALLNVGFDQWEPDNDEAEKNFDRFRHDVVALAGYYTLVIDLNGEPRAQADSISFGKMDEDTFTALYNKVVNVLLRRVLKNYTKEDLDNVVNQILEFG